MLPWKSRLRKTNYYALYRRLTVPHCLILWLVRKRELVTVDLKTVLISKDERGSKLRERSPEEKLGAKPVTIERTRIVTLDLFRSNLGGNSTYHLSWSAPSIFFADFARPTPPQPTIYNGNSPGFRATQWVLHVHKTISDETLIVWSTSASTSDSSCNEHSTLLLLSN